MLINRNNFEAYLLDYLEGNLDPLLTAELMAFLAENPEFENLIPDSEIQHLSATNLSLPDKKLLLKDYSDIQSLTPLNFEEFCIAECENLLADKDRERLQAYINEDPEKQKILDTYKQLKLDPRHIISFPDKTLLKKKNGKVFFIRNFYYGLSIAASIAIVFLLFFNRNIDRKSVPSATAVVSEIPQNTEPVTEAQPAAVQPIKKPVVSNGKSLSFPSRNQYTTVHITQPETQIERTDFIPPTLEPIQAKLIAEIPLSTDRLPENDYFRDNETESRNLLADVFRADSFFGSLVSHIDFWKTAEKAISGLNYLTESQLSVSRTIDENGNLTSLVVNTESYTIESSK